MNSTLLFLIAMMGGSGLSQPVVQALMDSQRDNFERWSRLLKSLGAIITTGVFFLRGMPTPVDEKGNPVFTNEAISKQIAASFTEGKREAFWVAVVNGVVEAITEFLRPSSATTALLTSLLNRPASQTTVINPGTPQMMPGLTTITQRTAGQVLRAQPNGFVRAQAVYVNPATGEIAVE